MTVRQMIAPNQSRSKTGPVGSGASPAGAATDPCRTYVTRLCSGADAASLP